MREEGIDISRNTPAEEFIFKIEAYLWDRNSGPDCLWVDDNGQKMLAKLLPKLVSRKDSMYFPEILFCQGNLNDTNLYVALDIKDSSLGSPFTDSTVGKITIADGIYLGDLSLSNAKIGEVEFLGSNEIGYAIFHNSKIDLVKFNGSIELSDGTFYDSKVKTAIFSDKVDYISKYAISKANGCIENIVIEDPNLKYEDFINSGKYAGITNYAQEEVLHEFRKGSSNLKSITFKNEDVYIGFMDTLAESLHASLGSNYFYKMYDDEEEAEEAAYEFFNSYPFEIKY